jgi:hypothetical protein
MPAYHALQGSLESEGAVEMLGKIGEAVCNNTGQVPPCAAQSLA